MKGVVVNNGIIILHKIHKEGFFFIGQRRNVQGKHIRTCLGYFVAGAVIVYCFRIGILPIGHIGLPIRRPTHGKIVLAFIGNGIKLGSRV